jgi:hypothetical protein
VVFIIQCDRYREETEWADLPAAIAYGEELACVLDSLIDIHNPNGTSFGLLVPMMKIELFLS